MPASEGLRPSDASSKRVAFVMPPILMTREERRLLFSLLERPLSASELPQNVASKFAKHGLVALQAIRYRITTKGQLEGMRQRFRNMARRRVVTVTAESFREKFDRAMAERLPARPAPPGADEAAE